MTVLTAERPGDRPADAAARMLVATALMGLADNFVVIIARTAGLWQFQVTRSAIALTLILVVARWQGWRVMPRRPSRVAARSLVMSTSLILYFAALSLMPVAQAVAGLFTAPLFMLLILAAFFGRRIGPVPIAAVVAGFAGLMLVIRPESGGLQWLSLLPVLAGLIYALGQLATREWCEGEGAVTLLVGFFVAMGLWGLVGLATLSLWQPAVPPGPEGFSFRLWGRMDWAAWACTLVQAVASPLGVGLMIGAYQRAEASFVAVFEYALLVFAVAFGLLLFGVWPDRLALAGIAVIIASGAVIVLKGAEPAASSSAGSGPRA